MRVFIRAQMPHQLESLILSRNNKLYLLSTFPLLLPSSTTSLPLPKKIMEAASSAISKMLSGAGQQEPKDEGVAPAVDERTVGQKDTTVEQEVAPAVQHEHIKKEHETREQTVVDKERHQDHFHQTIQPLQDQEIQAEKHDHKYGTPRSVFKSSIPIFEDEKVSARTELLASWGRELRSLMIARIVSAIANPFVL